MFFRGKLFVFGDACAVGRQAERVGLTAFSVRGNPGLGVGGVLRVLSLPRKDTENREGLGVGGLATTNDTNDTNGW